jgi:putative transposase
MTLWDLYAVKRYLKEKKISNYSEDNLFEAYELLEKMEQDVADTHKKQSLRKSKPPTISKINENTAVNKKENNFNDFDSLFDDIKIFEVTQKEIHND